MFIERQSKFFFFVGQQMLHIHSCCRFIKLHGCKATQRQITNAEKAVSQEKNKKTNPKYVIVTINRKAQEERRKSRAGVASAAGSDELPPPAKVARLQ